MKRTKIAINQVICIWYYEKFEDIKGVIRIRKSKKDRQYNSQRQKDKGTNNDLQNITQKTKDRATRTPLKIESELRCSRRASNSCSNYDTRRVILAANPVINHKWGKDQIVITTNKTYPWWFVTQILHNGGGRDTFVVMTSVISDFSTLANYSIRATIYKTPTHMYCSFASKL